MEVTIRLFDPLGARYLLELQEYFKPTALDTILGHRHQPNEQIRFRPWTFETNSDGLRGPELPGNKAANVFRVLVLGDSVAMGWGVPWEETVGPLLSPMLSAKRGAPVEVVVSATGSWNTISEVRDLYTRFGRFDPDAVILLYSNNDTDFRPDLGPEWHGKVGFTFPPPRGWQRLAVVQTVQALRLFLLPALKELAGADETATATSSASDPSAAASIKGKGARASAAALEAAHALCQTAGIPFRVVSFQRTADMRALLGQVSRESGFLWWDASPIFTVEFSKKTRISFLDSHFNGEGHRALARFIADSFSTELQQQPRVGRTVQVQAGTASGRPTPLPWGALYGDGLELPPTEGRPVFALIRVRDEQDSRVGETVPLVWSPPSEDLPDSITSGWWQPIIVPGMEGHARRLSIPASSGMMIESSQIQMVK